MAALGKFCEFQSGPFDAAALFPRWLELLPLREVLEESHAVSRRLCRYVTDRHPLVLGAPNYRHLGKVVSVLSAVAEEKFSRRMSEAVGEKKAFAFRQELASTLASIRATVPGPV